MTTVCLNLPQADGRLLSLWRTIGVLHTDMAGNALAQRSTRAQNFDAGTQNVLFLTCCFMGRFHIVKLRFRLKCRR